MILFYCAHTFNAGKVKDLLMAKEYQISLDSNNFS